MGGNFNYKKLVKDYKKNESIILLHAIIKQRNRMLWSMRRLAKINSKSKPVIKRFKIGIDKELDKLINP